MLFLFSTADPGSNIVASQPRQSEYQEAAEISDIHQFINQSINYLFN